MRRTSAAVSSAQAPSFSDDRVEPSAPARAGSSESAKSSGKDLTDSAGGSTRPRPQQPISEEVTRLHRGSVMTSAGIEFPDGTPTATGPFRERDLVPLPMKRALQSGGSIIVAEGPGQGR